ncbi:mannitol dehydrogenase family protein [Coraliomargarita sp. W4R53]
MSQKLNNQTLQHLNPSVVVPSYDRSQVKQSIMHIGVGGFHRAHQAMYADDLLKNGGDPTWGYCGVGLLKHDARIRDVMRAQDCLYTLVERSLEGDSPRVIGSIVNFLYAPEESERVLEQMASPDTRIVSMTITEGGYYANETTGELDATHPDLVHDLENPHSPKCAFGYILEAFDRQRLRGLTPFTLMSCDNVQGNGSIAKKRLMAYAELRDPKLRNWMEANCLFPNSMVDRITPCTTDDNQAMVLDKFGIDDGWPVMTESFKQWVIEDHFVQGRPAWETVGAQMTSDVMPYEKMKLRLLNASHQALTYSGLLFGYEFVHETMEDPDIRHFVERFMNDEVSEVVAEVEGVDLAEYKKTLIERFANPAIRDQLSRIGIYGSPGIPQFLLPSIQEQLKRGGSITLMSLTIALWFRYLSGLDEAGKPMPMRDAMGDQLKQIALASGHKPDGLLAVRAVFGQELASNAEFVRQVSKHLENLYTLGVRETIRLNLK